MGFLSKIFKKKFDVQAARRDLLSKISALQDKYRSAEIDNSLERLRSTANANLTQDVYESLTRQIEQLERDISNMSQKKASKIVNRAVDNMTGAGRTRTAQEKNIEYNEDVIDENTEEIDKLYSEIKTTKNQLDYKERKLAGIKDEDSPEYMKLDAECELLDMQLQGMESEYARRLETMKSSLNMNIQTNQSKQVKEQYKHTDRVAKQMQELDIAGLEAMSEESEQVMQEQAESSERMSKIATFNKTNFSRRSRNRNKTADATQLEVEKSLGGKSMDEALSQLGSEED